MTFGFGAAGGTLEVAGTLSIDGDLLAFNSADGLIHVLAGGTLNRTSGTGTTTLQPAVENDGTITTGATSGVLSLAGGDGAGSSSGAYTPAGTGVVSFTGGTSELTATASVGGTGTFEVGGGTVQVASGATYAAGTTSMSGGTFTFDATGTTNAFNSSGGTRDGRARSPAARVAAASRAAPSPVA